MVPQVVIYAPHDYMGRIHSDGWMPPREMDHPAMVILPLQIREGGGLKGGRLADTSVSPPWPGESIGVRGQWQTLRVLPLQSRTVCVHRYIFVTSPLDLRIVMMPTLLSLAAPEVVVMTSYGAASDIPFRVTLNISGSPIESQWGSQKYPG